MGMEMLPQMAPPDAYNTAITGLQQLNQIRQTNLANQASAIKNQYLTPMMQSQLALSRARVPLLQAQTGLQQAQIPLTQAKTAALPEQTAIQLQAALTNRAKAELAGSPGQMGAKYMQGLRALPMAQRANVLAQHASFIAQLQGQMGAEAMRGGINDPSVLGQYGAPQAAATPTYAPPPAGATPYSTPAQIEQQADVGRSQVQKSTVPAQILAQRTYAQSARNMYNSIAPDLNTVSKFAGLSGRVDIEANKAKAFAGLDTSPEYQTYYNFAHVKAPILAKEFGRALGMQASDTAVKYMNNLMNPIWVMNNSALVKSHFAALDQMLTQQEKSLSSSPGQTQRFLAGAGSAQPGAQQSPAGVAQKIYVTKGGKWFRIPSNQRQEAINQGYSIHG